MCGYFFVTGFILKWYNSPQMSESDVHRMHEAQKEFFLHAVEEGVHLKIPPYYTQESWDKKIDILSMRLSGGLSLSEIQQICGVNSPSQAGDHQLRGIVNLYNNASADLQEAYPLSVLTNASVQEHPRRRRTHSMVSRRKISEAKGGVSVSMARQLEEGVPLDVVESNVPYTSTQIVDAERKTLKKWGFDVYETEKERDQRWISTLTKPDATYEEKKDVLDNITLSFYKRHTGDLFIALMKYLGEHGYHSKGDVGVFVTILEQNKDVPVGEVRNRSKDWKTEKKEDYAIHAISKADIERANQVLENNHLAQRYKQNPVVQISGGKVDYAPSTGDIRRNPHFRRVTKFMKENGIGIDKKGRRLFTPNEFIQGDAEVHVWEYQNRYYFFDEDEEALREYLLRRGDELRMVH